MGDERGFESLARARANSNVFLTGVGLKNHLSHIRDGSENCPDTNYGYKYLASLRQA